MQITSLSPRSASLPRWKLALPEWGPVVIGLLALYGPSFYDLVTGLWMSEEQAHGPIILLLSTWLLYRKWPEMMVRTEGQPSSGAGWVVALAGLVLYLLGRTQQFPIFEIGSYIVMLAAVLLVKRGSLALRMMWFPLFFMLFMVPLPGIVVVTLTMPMKTAVSYVTEQVLFFVGYPIARSGVILQIGQYQLMVADACAGLHTLFTLEALGLFYLNLVRHTSALRNGVLAVLIIPISFTANVIRVISLTLITYYFGDAAGQGFLHGFAGMVLFISALLLIMGVDWLLQSLVVRREKKHA